MKTRIAALWIWWTACSALLLWLWASALASSNAALEHQTRATVNSGLRELPSAFAALHKLQTVLVHSREPWPTLEAQARPFLKLHRPPAAWMTPGVHRPLPPGYEAGKGLARPDDLPESYLIVASPTMAAELDLDYVFGPWLRDQVARWKLPGEVRVRRVPPEETWKESRLQEGWRWRVPSLWGDETFPFDAVELEVDLAPALEHNTRLYLLGLAAGAAIMLTFALTIRLAARAVGREIQLVEARSRFMAMVSHELRTPVAAIKMYAEILENGLVGDQEKLASYHRILSGEAGRLGRLVENLLELGSLEGGGRGFTLTTFDVCELLRDYPEFTGAGEHLVKGDRQALTQVFRNLVDNARKYGVSGVTVEVRRTSGGVAVDVMDRGPGIPPAERRRIFEPYRRLQQEGVGLGLALVKGLVEGQGGTVEVTERPGGGARFTVTLQCP